MISLDDPKWENLKGGYRLQYDASPALRQIEEGASVEDAWEELWNELHHQGDIGEASLAAVPHLVRIQQAKAEVDRNVYALLSTIEIGRHRKGNPPLPHWLEQDYHQAWSDVMGLAFRDLLKTHDPLAVRSILGTLALAKQLVKLGMFIVNTDESEIDELLEDRDAWTELYSEQADAN